MNRRSFIAGILAACVAPKVLIPRQKDAFNWRVSRCRGLYIAEFKYACKPYGDKALREFIFFRSDQAIPHFEPNPKYVSTGYIFRDTDYAGKWSFRVGYKANADGTITFGSVVT